VVRPLAWHPGLHCRIPDAMHLRCLLKRVTQGLDYVWAFNRHVQHVGAREADDDKSLPFTRKDGELAVGAGVVRALHRVLRGMRRCRHRDLAPLRAAAFRVGVGVVPGGRVAPEDTLRLLDNLVDEVRIHIIAVVLGHGDLQGPCRIHRRQTLARRPLLRRKAPRARHGFAGDILNRAGQHLCTREAGEDPSTFDARLDGELAFGARVVRASDRVELRVHRGRALIVAPLGPPAFRVRV